MVRPSHSLHEYLPRILLLGVHAPYNRTTNIESYFQEFRNLAHSNGIKYQKELYIKLRTIDSTYFFTEGKLAEIKKFCSDNSIDQVIVSETLTPLQERNIQDMVHCKVFDRTQLILEIFEKAAHSSEGKAQVAIAMYLHKKNSHGRKRSTHVAAGWWHWHAWGAG